MGCWDIFCFICGNNCNNLGDNKKLNWKIDCTLLLANNDVVHDCVEQSCNVDFQNIKTNERYSANIYDNDIDYFDDYITNQGIFLHTDCWKYIKKEYKIELQYKDLPIFYTNFAYEPIKIEYGDIKNYWGQDLDYEQMDLDKKIYMAYSPLESDNIKNITRIKKIVSQLKLKKEIRKGPSVSATFYPNKSIKLGNNNLFWEKKNGKWVELKEKPIIKLYEFNQKPKNTRKIEYTPQIGQHNTIPLFVNNFYIKNKIYYIEFIGSEKMIKELDVFINKLNK